MRVGAENKIRQLKEKKNAIILAHYYAPSEIQEVADYVGDSFYLAKIAKNSDANVIVFCGVGFMGESAKILNPNKKVLMPDVSADCPMAHMVKAGKIEEMRAKYDDLAVVCYINSTAELKCQSDVCVTSSNAVKIVKALPNKNIFFIPDKNLGRYVAEQVPEKNIILNDGYCPIHVRISVEELLEEKKLHPNALVLSHPECEQKILELSDYIGSTAEIIDFAKQSACTEFIICTEDGVKFKLETDNPNKKFYFTKTSPCCVDMKLNTLDKLLKVLETEEHQILLDEETISRAKLPLDRMLELAK
ncbi:MAG: quinolinate synthase NadA [Clostridia bacterium]|nr:quinolinate synthase NadA [Clostridia bacterium]